MTFITHALIAKTKRLSSNYVNDAFSHKRLDFDHHGKYLAAALNNTWEIIETPQNNLSIILNTLRNLLPEELIRYIVINIINSYKQTYDFVDFKSLWHVKPIKPADIDYENVDHMQLKPETKHIVFIYKRKRAPPQPSRNDYEQYDHWRNRLWQEPRDY